MMKTKIRLAGWGTALSVLQDKLELHAVCDHDEAILLRWLEQWPHLKSFSSFDALLEWGEFDAVLLATPVPLHAAQSVQALRAGKHVLSEVVAATTLDECWELVETVEQTGLTYMMAENYCYMRPNMMVLNMVEAGVFGEITHAEGAYIHDTRSLTVTPDGSLTWRGELHRLYNRNRYPTHSIGPVAQWLRINREGGDRFDTASTFVSKPVNLSRYIHERFGAEHPGANPNYWRQGDSAVTLINTEKGALIVIRVDACSPRPHNMTHYALQGTTTSYLSARHHAEDPIRNLVPKWYPKELWQQNFDVLAKARPWPTIPVLADLTSAVEQAYQQAIRKTSTPGAALQEVDRIIQTRLIEARRH